MNTIRRFESHTIWFKAGRKQYIEIPCINPRDYSSLVEHEFGIDKLPRTKRWQFNNNVKPRFSIQFLRIFTERDARIMSNKIIKHRLFDVAMGILEGDE